MILQDHFAFEYGRMVGYAEAILQQPDNNKAMNLLCRLADGIDRKVEDYMQHPKEAVLLSQLGMVNTYLNGVYCINEAGLDLVYSTARLKLND